MFLVKRQGPGYFLHVNCVTLQNQSRRYTVTRTPIQGNLLFIVLFLHLRLSGKISHITWIDTNKHSCQILNALLHQNVFLQQLMLKRNAQPTGKDSPQRLGVTIFTACFIIFTPCLKIFEDVDNVVIIFMFQTKIKFKKMVLLGLLDAILSVSRFHWCYNQTSQDCWSVLLFSFTYSCTPLH